MARVQHQQAHDLLRIEPRVDPVQQAAERMADQDERAAHAGRSQQRAQAARVAFGVQRLGVGLAPAQARAVVAADRVFLRQHLLQPRIDRRDDAGARFDHHGRHVRIARLGAAAAQVQTQAVDLVEPAGRRQRQRPGLMRIGHARPVVEAAHAVWQVREVHVERARRGDVEHRLGQRRELRMEMLGRLDDDQLLACQRDAEAGEQLRRHHLAASADQHDVDAAVDLHPDAGAERRALPVGAEARLREFLVDRHHGHRHVERCARGRAALSAEPQVDARADARVAAQLHRAEVPERADRHVADALLEQRTQEEGAVAHRAAAGVVADVGQHDRAAVGRERLGLRQRGRDTQARRAGLLAQVPERTTELLGDAGRQRRIVVGHDPELGAGFGHVGPGKAVAQRHREHAGLPLGRLHAAHEAGHRLARRVPQAHHAAVEHGRRRPHPALRGVEHDPQQLAHAGHGIDVRILLVGHDRVSRAPHQLGEVAVQVELDADRHAGPDDLAHAGQQIAFAIGIAVGHHRAVQDQEQAVDRPGGERRAQVGQDLVAQRFVDGAHRHAAGHGEGADALDQLMALFGQPAAQQPRELAITRGVARAGVAAEDAVRLEAAPA